MTKNNNITKEKMLSLYKEDFTSDDVWRQICDSLDIDTDTNFEVKIIYKRVEIVEEV